jgi:non-specific serine/threonine protein kinase
LGEFELTGVLGEGGFAIVYLAYDHSLRRVVAIKEYMPGAIATRAPDGTVIARSAKHEATFRAGLDSFLNEARMLAQFDHPALIRIHRFWEQNGTAYIAMQYCDGRTLRQLRQDEPETVKDETWLKTTFAPVLDALELLHSSSCFHRDISPDNILVLSSGVPILLDFGAARQVIGDMTQALTVILKPGFAPIEQYADDATLAQGPWTDIYGLGAVLYFALLGKPPVASVARMVKDPMPKLADQSVEPIGASQPFLSAIDHALVVHPDQRIRSIAELRHALQLPTFKPDVQRRGIEAAARQVSSAHAFHSSAEQPSALSNALADSASTLQPKLPAVVSRSTSKAEPSDNKTTAPGKPVLDSASVPVPQRKNRSIWGATAGLVVAGSIAAWLVFKPQPVNLGAESVEPAITTASRQESASASQLATPAADQQMTIDRASEKPAEAFSVNSGIPIAPSTEAVLSPSVRPIQAASAAASAPLRTASAAPPQSILGESTPSRDIRTTSPPATAASSPLLPASKASERSLPLSTAVDVGTGAQLPNASAVPGSDDVKPKSPAVPTAPGAYVQLLVRPWGNVLVDGESKGVSPPLGKLWLPVGTHTITIENTDFPSFTKQVTVSDKKDVAVSHRFGG